VTDTHTAAAAAGGGVGCQVLCQVDNKFIACIINSSPYSATARSCMSVCLSVCLVQLIHLSMFVQRLLIDHSWPTVQLLVAWQRATLLTIHTTLCTVNVMLSQSVLAVLNVYWVTWQ